MKLFTTILLLSFSPIFSSEAKVCFDTTKTSKIPAMNLPQGSFNPEGTAYISNTIGMMGGLGAMNSAQDKIILHDLKTNTTKTFPKKLNEMASWNSEGTITLIEMNMTEFKHDMNAEEYLAHLKKIKYSKIDPNTGKRLPITGDMILPDGTEVKIEKVIKVGDKATAITKDKTGKTIELAYSTGPETVFYDYQKMMSMTHKDGVFKVIKYNKEVFSAKIESPTSQKSSDNFEDRFAASSTEYNRLNIYLSPQGGHVAVKNSNKLNTSTGSENYLLIDIKSKKQINVDLPKGITFQPVPKKENLIFVRKQNDKDFGLHILDIKTGKLNKVPGGDFTNPTLEENGNICGLKYSLNVAQFYGGQFPGMGSIGYGTTTFGQMSKTPASPVKYECTNKDGTIVSSIKVADSDQMITALGNNKFITSSMHHTPTSEGSKLVIPQETCVEKIEFIACNCETPKSDLLPTDALLGINLKLACQENYSAELWTNLASKPLKKLDEKSGLLWLKKFSKPEGFSAKDLDVFSTLLDAKLYDIYPGEFKAALANIMNTSVSLYIDILKKYPSLKKLPADAQKDCITNKEAQEINASKREFVHAQRTKMGSPSEEALVEFIDLTKNILTTEEKEKLADDLGDLAVERMGLDPILKDAFPSKVHKFSSNYIKKMMDLPHKDLTDITLLRDNGFINFVQLGVGPFEGSKPTTGGFHLKVLSTRPDSQYKNKTSAEEFKWDYNGKKYSAKIDIKNETSSTDITPPSLAPNYKEMKKDKAFRGMIVAGTNLGKSTTDMVVRQYIQYFSDQGFEFEVPADVDDLPALLKARVSGNEPAHYLVKEAHSDGDEKNLFRINNKGKVLTGTKIVNGKKEIIEIVYPGEDQTSTLLSNNKFGDWMKEREAKKGAELLYINSSCWSASKATYEIAAANSPKLVNIPTTTSMVTFTNHENNVMYAAIDGIRKEKSYADIRQDMEKDPEYKAKVNNVMIFPDEPTYTKVIRDKIKVPLNVETTITLHDKNGPKSYSIEQ